MKRAIFSIVICLYITFATSQTGKQIQIVAPAQGDVAYIGDTLLIKWTGDVVDLENVAVIFSLSVDGCKSFPYFLVICSGGYDTAFYKYALTPRLGMENTDSLVSNKCHIRGLYYLSGQIDFILGGDTSEVFSILPATTAARRPAAITNRTSIVPTTTSSFTLSGRLLPTLPPASSVHLHRDLKRGFIGLR